MVKFRSAGHLTVPIIAIRYGLSSGKSIVDFFWLLWLSFLPS